jgi:membrane-associated phospholipid phosphatase
LGEGIGSAFILAVETITVMGLVLVRITYGKIPSLGEALAVACLTSICSYGIDDNVLKLFFGVPNPFDVLHGAEHAFNFWKGSPDSSFPSGHMVLAAAFAGVFMRLYRASIWPLSILLLVAAGLLIVGDWHFLSDVIAGAFAGISAGLLAGELWTVHLTKSFPVGS